MAAAITDKDIDQLENEWKTIKPQIDRADIDKARVEAARDQMKKELKEHLQTLRALGVPEDDIEGEVRKLYEVAKIKKDNAEADLKAFNEVMQPLLKELE